MFNFFSSNQSDKSIIAKVISKDTSTMVSVQDRKNRVFQAESDGSYPIGTTVLIKNQVVIGRTKQSSDIGHSIV